MKKYIGFLIVLSIFVLGASKVQAGVSQNTICDSTTIPSITVLSPNGGETYVMGQSIVIKWSTCNAKEGQTVSLSIGKEVPLAQNNGISGAINPLVSFYPYQITNDGAETVILSGSSTNGDWPFTSGNNFKVSATLNPLSTNTIETPYVQDSSNNLFTINSSSIGNGCSNGEKYSSTTGQMCTEYGCSHGEKYSSTTGQACLANGCLHGEKYSSTSGQACPEIVDTGCNGSIYSTTTGKICPIISVATAYPVGCKSSEGYSSVTGISCNGACSPSGVGCNKSDTKPILTFPLGCTSFDGISSVTGVACKACSPSTGAGCSDSNITLPTIQRILKIGVKGEDVKTIQTLLGLTADGVYGPITAKKVKEWQASKELKVDGVFGPASFQKILSN